MKRRLPPRHPEIVDEKQYADFITRVGRKDGAGRLDLNPDLTPAVLDDSYPHFDTAVDNHEMWHQKRVETAYKKNVSFSPKMVCIGRAEEIVYLSAKWEEHADFFSYVHYFDTHPEVYADPRHFDGVRPRSTAALLSVKRAGPKDRLATPILARVAEFTYVDNDGATQVMRFDFPPTMLCSPDKEGLIILSEGMGPLIVRGGQMEITERGIVK